MSERSRARKNDHGLYMTPALVKGKRAPVTDFVFEAEIETIHGVDEASPLGHGLARARTDPFQTIRIPAIRWNFRFTVLAVF